MHRGLRPGGWAVSSCVRCSIRVEDPGALFYGTRNPTVTAQWQGPAGFPYFLTLRVSREPHVWLRAIDFFWLPGAHLILPFRVISLITLSAMMSAYANLSSVVCRKENLKKWVSRMTILLQISLHRSWSHSEPRQAWQDPTSAVSQTWP